MSSRTEVAPSPFFGLPQDVLALQAEARQFALEKLRPSAAEQEWREDPRDRVAWDLVEELAYGDMGFAVILDQTLKVQRILDRLATGASRELFLSRFLTDPRMVLAICFTEPETSSDYIIGTDFRFRTRAEQRPDDTWLLNGYKHYISNGADAGLYLVFASTDREQRAERGTSAFLLEPGMPGFEVAEVHEKISQRTINNAALRFTNVVVGPERLVGKAHVGYAGAREILKESAIEAGATTLGTARAAYELAVEHASQRVQGGRPLIEHGNVGCRLAEMFAELEAARSLIWRAAWAVEHDPEYDYRLGSAAKTFAADVAVRVCLSALEIHGGLAVMYQDSGVEKCLRDCLSFLHSDGAQDSHRLRVADMIRRGGA